LIYLKAVFGFANIDLLAKFSEKNILSHMSIHETTAFSPHFNSLGFESQNWILLSGGLFLMVALILMFQIFKWVTNWICGKCRRYEIARIIGTKVYEPEH